MESQIESNPDRLTRIPRKIPTGDLADGYVLGRSIKGYDGFVRGRGCGCVCVCVCMDAVNNSWWVSECV